MELGDQTHRVSFMIRNRRLELHRRIGRRPRRHRHPDRALQHPGALHERDCRRWIGGCRHELLDRTLIWSQAMCSGSCASTRPPQSAPASPLPARSPAAETAARAGRSRPAPRPKIGSRRWPDQRIPPGRMTWTRFSEHTISISSRNGSPALGRIRQAFRITLIPASSSCHDPGTRL
jgi:hypothetical protein